MQWVASKKKVNLYKAKGRFSQETLQRFARFPNGFGRFAGKGKRRIRNALPDHG
jgi:hypothetical protein